MTRRRYRNPGDKRAAAVVEPAENPQDTRGKKHADGAGVLSCQMEAVGRLMSLLEILPDAKPPPNLLARTLRRVDLEQEYSGVAG